VRFWALAGWRDEEEDDDDDDEALLVLDAPSPDGDDDVAAQKAAATAAYDVVEAAKAKAEKVQRERMAERDAAAAAALWGGL
jgi:hypothetical protein